MTTTSAPDILGQALLDYHHGKVKDAIVTVHCSAADDEPLPAAYFFRTVLQMPELERQALDESRGRVLDLGAGAGCHSLELQSRGFEVKAVDVSAGAVQVMTERGVRNVARHDLFAPKPATELPYDTILLLMNGLGLTGTLEGLDKFLGHARTLLAPGGQILATSSDVRYLYEDEDGALLINLNGPYYGEVQYTLSYKGKTGEPFPWLFVDAALLNDAAEAAGYTADFIGEDENEQYLVRLTPLN
ncbi:class I SAM-dependent methyltransferase [Hymenobacter properus]|uniref:Class I SAM-dependent methyltransferase n=1 Tax=Hymenobacter properus TaxID=2791026 RepID=A0A931BI12_9BACT|nr:methyltransferase domain-containing protein [Hymenobacter properus]MBF9143959.1 class I SAM-dependent methyltransferase [Hymenobacter properus]MBR7722774.1 class I SAM-dependent methyltransferase [Microvirga sp. SRT04]